MQRDYIRIETIWRFLLSPECDLSTGEEFFTLDGLIAAMAIVAVIACITGVWK
jgi:hypothetical protein